MMPMVSLKKSMVPRKSLRNLHSAFIAAATWSAREEPLFQVPLGDYPSTTSANSMAVRFSWERPDS